ncbi:MAG: transcription-repair coupling factor [Dehalococcoidia bacterium]|nr:transcription-repair coupling factor [Dehalococcoidia bacterium]
MLKGVAEILTGLPQFRRMADNLQAGQKESLSILPSAKALALGAIWQEMQVPVLVVVPRPEDARRLYDQLTAYWGDNAPIHQFAELEALPFEHMTADNATTQQRLWTLAALAGVHSQEYPPIVVASVPGVALKTLAPPVFQLPDGCHVVRHGDRVAIGSLLARWAAMGYRMERVTQAPGAMSRRGGIVDIFPVGERLPVRLEFWGDVLESLRTFDPGTQRSLEPVEQTTVIPARELLPAKADHTWVEQAIRNLDASKCSPQIWSRIEEDLSLLMAGQEVEDASFYAGFFSRHSVLEFLPAKAVLVVDQPSEVEEAFREIDRRSFQLREGKLGRGELPGAFPSPYFVWEEVAQRLQQLPRRLDVSRWAGEQPASFPFTQAPSFVGRMDSFLEEVRTRSQGSQRVVVVTGHAQRLQELMAEAGLGPSSVDSIDHLPPTGSITLVHGSLAEGWIASSEPGTVLFTDTEVFGTAKIHRPRRVSVASRQPLAAEITPGSFVVHTDHGVARFAGTTTMGEAAEEQEYLVLEYAEGDKLYVPSEHTDRVTPYVTPGDQPPTLTRLGTQEWAHTKARVKRSAHEMAQELLALYAVRESTPGFGMGEDTPWQREMEDSFPYQETPDQIATIAQVKEDMERSRPMDRLVCGDVGYGKTEIALRAAFKAIASGMQVAVLVPTTVLAQQHYTTFSQRLKPYPVTVEVLSRFRTDQEQRAVVEGLASGKVDICIGTHRLLQKDVQFKNLGLVIVDEEHRFGVAHKERFKQMRAQVDVLTLTATPIPRTLHMALSGIRDMSTMETPPEERLPIKTYVSEDSDDMVREAILRELDRGGQVYYLHNRVQSIARVAEGLRQLVPEATFAIGHGRMQEDDLEKVMNDFSKDEFDVLVCTTIIESGLDLPNVNTLIVDRADALGLAQLYQLRGRIGRGSHRAYAYFMVPRGKRITETAQKRLETILSASELGAGFHVAMKDLEIRGAGRVLGGEQSGHIHAVGYELYSQLLAQAVEELKASPDAPMPAVGAPQEEQAQIAVNLRLPARIPTDYVEDLPTRLALYQHLSRARSLEEVDQVQAELWDRFGPLPREAHNLLYTIRVRALAHAADVETVTKEPESVMVRLREDVGGARPALEKELGPQVRVGGTLLHLDFKHLDRPWGQALLEMLERLAAFRQRVMASAG